MSEPTIWVCSKWNTEPKDSEKRQVRDVNESYYQAVKSVDGYIPYFLKSDYIPCAPPEQWERVEAEVEQETHRDGSRCVRVDGKYVGKYVGRINLVPNYRVVSLVVERRTS